MKANSSLLRVRHRMVIFGCALLLGLGSLVLTESPPTLASSGCTTRITTGCSLCIRGDWRPDGRTWRKKKISCPDGSGYTVITRGSCGSC